MRGSPEFELIAAVRERLGGSGDSRHVVGIGDDAAVTVPGGATATSVDAVVDGVHFRSRWCPPRSIGRKAMAAALSDLAAMGAAGGEAYVWLGRPDSLDPGGCLELADGLAEVASECGVVILGGDLTSSPVLAVSVTAVGHAQAADDLVGRDGAVPGEAVCLTGSAGGAAAGLLLLEREDLRAKVPEAAAEAVLARQLDPTPRLTAGRALAAAGATAMIDLSDGLGADAEQLATASAVGIEIEAERVPVAEGVAEVAAAAGRDPLDLLSGGEDYELLCTLPAAGLSTAQATLDEAGVTLSEIGRVDAGSGVRLRLAGGRLLPVAGHDQLRR